MRKLLLLLLTIAAPIFAQTGATLGSVFVGTPFLNITTSNGIVDASDAPMAQGTFCVYATDQNDAPLAFEVNGTQQAAKATICRNIVNGTLASTLQLANPLATLPLNIRYHVTITNTMTHVATQYPAVSIIAASTDTAWDWSKWNPSLSQPAITENTGPIGPQGPVGATGPAGPAGTGGAGSVAGPANSIIASDGATAGTGHGTANATVDANGNLVANSVSVPSSASGNSGISTTQVTVTADPTTALQLATKGYVDKTGHFWASLTAPSNSYAYLTAQPACTVNAMTGQIQMTTPVAIPGLGYTSIPNVTYTGLPSGASLGTIVASAPVNGQITSYTISGANSGFTSAIGGGNPCPLTFTVDPPAGKPTTLADTYAPTTTLTSFNTAPRSSSFCSDDGDGTTDDTDCLIAGINFASDQVKLNGNTTGSSAPSPTLDLTSGRTYHIAGVNAWMPAAHHDGTVPVTELFGCTASGSPQTIICNLTTQANYWPSNNAFTGSNFVHVQGTPGTGATFTPSASQTTNCSGFTGLIGAARCGLTVTGSSIAGYPASFNVYVGETCNGGGLCAVTAPWIAGYAPIAIPVTQSLTINCHGATLKGDFTSVVALAGPYGMAAPYTAIFGNTTAQGHVTLNQCNFQDVFTGVLNPGGFAQLEQPSISGRVLVRSFNSQYTIIDQQNLKSNQSASIGLVWSGGIATTRSPTYGLEATAALNDDNISDATNINFPFYSAYFTSSVAQFELLQQYNDCYEETYYDRFVDQAALPQLAAKCGLTGEVPFMPDQETTSLAAEAASFKGVTNIPLVFTNRYGRQSSTIIINGGSLKQPVYAMTAGPNASGVVLKDIGVEAGGFCWGTSIAMGGAGCPDLYDPANTHPQCAFLINGTGYEATNLGTSSVYDEPICDGTPSSSIIPNTTLPAQRGGNFAFQGTHNNPLPDNQANAQANSLGKSYYHPYAATTQTAFPTAGYISGSVGNALTFLAPNRMNAAGNCSSNDNAYLNLLDDGIPGKDAVMSIFDMFYCDGSGLYDPAFEARVTGGLAVRPASPQNGEFTPALVSGGTGYAQNSEVYGWTTPSTQLMFNQTAVYYQAIIVGFTNAAGVITKVQCTACGKGYNFIPAVTMPTPSGGTAAVVTGTIAPIDGYAKIDNFAGCPVTPSGGAITLAANSSQPWTAAKCLGTLAGDAITYQDLSAAGLPMDVHVQAQNAGTDKINFLLTNKTSSSYTFPATMWFTLISAGTPRVAPTASGTPGTVTAIPSSSSAVGGDLASNTGGTGYTVEGINGTPLASNGSVPTSVGGTGATTALQGLWNLGGEPTYIPEQFPGFNPAAGYDANMQNANNQIKVLFPTTRSLLKCGQRTGVTFQNQVLLYPMIDIDMKSCPTTLANGGGGGAWNATPLPLNNCRVTLGGNLITGCTSITGLTQYMWVGGGPLSLDSNVSAPPSGGNFNLSLPVNLAVTGNVTQGQPTMCGASVLNNIQAGQGVSNPTYFTSGTTIISTALAGTTQCITLSNNALQTSNGPILLNVSGTVTGMTLYAEKDVAAFSYAFNGSAPVDNYGLNNGMHISNLEFVDPNYHVLPQVARQTGVAGIQICGADHWTVENVLSHGFGGPTLTIGGAGCPNPVREGSVRNFRTIDSGDFLTGQTDIVNMSPVGISSSDENNTINFYDVNLVNSAAAGYAQGTYNTYHQAVNAKGPRLIKFIGGQNEGGSTYGVDLAAPFPNWNIYEGDDVEWTNMSTAAAGYGQSLFQTRDIHSYLVGNSSNFGLGKNVSFNVTVSSSTPNVVTFVSAAGATGAETGFPCLGQLNGVGGQLNGVNVFAVKSGAVDSTCQNLTLTANAATTGAQTLVLGAAKSFYEDWNVGAPNELDTRELTAVNSVAQDAMTLSLFAIPANGGFISGYPDFGGEYSYAHIKYFQGSVNINKALSVVGNITVQGLTIKPPAHFATFQTCSSSIWGAEDEVDDSTTQTFNATVTGGGTYSVGMRCNESNNWVVY